MNRYLISYPGICTKCFFSNREGYIWDLKISYINYLGVSRMSLWLNALKPWNTGWFLACEYKMGWFMPQASGMSSFIVIVVVFLQHLMLSSAAICRYLGWIYHPKQQHEQDFKLSLRNVEKYTWGIWYVFFPLDEYSNHRMHFLGKITLSRFLHSMLCCCCWNIFHPFLSAIHKDKFSQIHYAAFWHQPSLAVITSED